MLTFDHAITLVVFLLATIASHIYFRRRERKVWQALNGERRARLELGKKCLHLCKIVYNDGQSNKRQIHMLMETFAEFAAERDDDDVTEDRAVKEAGPAVLQS